MNNKEEKINSYEHLEILRTIVFKALFNSPGDSCDTIVDRVICLLDGDMDKIENLLVGIPVDFLNVQERLKAEDYLKDKINKEKVEIRNIKFNENGNITVSFSYIQSRFIKKGDDEEKKKVIAQGYTSNSSYCKTDIYTEEVKYESDECYFVSANELTAHNIKLMRL